MRSASPYYKFLYIDLNLIGPISKSNQKDFKQCGAKPTPKLRATMFSALSYYPNSLSGSKYIKDITEVVPIQSNERI